MYNACKNEINVGAKQKKWCHYYINKFCVYQEAAATAVSCFWNSL